MGLGTTKSAKRDAVFVDLKFAEPVGFRQTIGRTAREGAKEGERKFDYQYQMHDFVEGNLAGFRVKEEPRYDDPTQKDLVGYATIRDTDGGPDVVIRFPLLGQAGRKMVGLLAAAEHAKAGAVHLYTNFAEAGTRIGDKVLEKPQAYLNCKVGNSLGEKLVPLYYGEDGAPLLDDKGHPKPLPMGVKHVIARKEVWDFSDADNQTASTAAKLMQLLQPKQGVTDAHTEGHEDAHADAHAEIDLNEAANVAMRP